MTPIESARPRHLPRWPRWPQRSRQPCSQASHQRRSLHACCRSPSSVRFAARLQGLVQDRVGVPVPRSSRSTRPRSCRSWPTSTSWSPSCSTGEMAAAGRRLKLVQVPAAGLDSDRPPALPPRRLAGERLRPRGGHRRVRDRRDPDRGTAGSAGRIHSCGGRNDSRWAVGSPPPPRRARREDARRPRLRADRAGLWPSGPGRSTWRSGHPARSDAAGILRGGLSRRTGRPRTGVLRRADYLVVTSPLAPRPAACLGQRELALMKPTAVWSTSREPRSSDEEALYEALHRGVIAGAILDVSVPVPDRRRADAAVAPAVPRARQRADDARTYIGVDRRDARGARGGHRGEHPPRRAREAPLNLVATGSA